MQKFHVVSMGPGSPEYILPAADKVISEAEALLGSEHLINANSKPGQSLIPLAGSVSAFMEELEKTRRQKKCAVLVTGDAGFYSLLAAVRRNFKPGDYIVIPGITAFQLACARLGLNWQDYMLASAHGKSLESMLSKLQPERGAIILTDKKNTPQKIASFLKKNGWEDRPGWVCENISKENETIEEIKLHSIDDKREYGLCLMILQPE